jgi:hypothetical protein
MVFLAETVYCLQQNVINNTRLVRNQFEDIVMQTNSRKILLSLTAYCCFFLLPIASITASEASACRNQVNQWYRIQIQRLNHEFTTRTQSRSRYRNARPCAVRLCRNRSIPLCHTRSLSGFQPRTEDQFGPVRRCSTVRYHYYRNLLSDLDRQRDQRLRHCTGGISACRGSQRQRINQQHSQAIRNCQQIHRYNAGARVQCQESARRQYNQSLRNCSAY